MMTGDEKTCYGISMTLGVPGPTPQSLPEKAGNKTITPTAGTSGEAWKNERDGTLVLNPNSPSSHPQEERGAEE